MSDERLFTKTKPPFESKSLSKEDKLEIEHNNDLWARGMAEQMHKENPRLTFEQCYDAINYGI